MFLWPGRSSFLGEGKRLAAAFLVDNLIHYHRSLVLLALGCCWHWDILRWTKIFRIQTKSGHSVSCKFGWQTKLNFGIASHLWVRDRQLSTNDQSAGKSGHGKWKPSRREKRDRESDRYWNRDTQPKKRKGVLNGWLLTELHFPLLLLWPACTDWWCFLATTMVDNLLANRITCRR